MANAPMLMKCSHRCWKSKRSDADEVKSPLMEVKRPGADAVTADEVHRPVANIVTSLLPM